MSHFQSPTMARSRSCPIMELSCDLAMWHSKSRSHSPTEYGEGSQPKDSKNTLCDRDFSVFLSHDVPGLQMDTKCPCHNNNNTATNSSNSFFDRLNEDIKGTNNNHNDNCDNCDREVMENFSAVADILMPSLPVWTSLALKEESARVLRNNSTGSPYIPTDENGNKRCHRDAITFSRVNTPRGGKVRDRTFFNQNSGLSEVAFVNGVTATIISLNGAHGLIGQPVGDVTTLNNDAGNLQNKKQKCLKMSEGLTDKTFLHLDCEKSLSPDDCVDAWAFIVVKDSNVDRWPGYFEDSNEGIRAGNISDSDLDTVDAVEQTVSSNIYSAPRPSNPVARILEFAGSGDDNY